VREWRGDFDVTRKTEASSRRGSIAVPHLMLAATMALALATRVGLHGRPRPALLWTAVAFVVASLLLACTELLSYPAQFQRGLYARRRALVSDRLGPPEGQPS
jgi:hypothetical protein